MAELVRVTRSAERVARLTIDRPERRNALSIQVRDEMSDALDELAADESLHVVVLASTGPVFCAGFDLKEFEDESLQDRLWASSERWHDRVRTFPLPVVASVQGPALAGGFDLATMCDLRVAARSATFGRPEVRWTTPLYGVLRDLVGGALARELSFTSRTLTAEEAHGLGLVTRVVDDDELGAATTALAEEVASVPREAVLRTKARAVKAAESADSSSFVF